MTVAYFDYLKEEQANLEKFLNYQGLDEEITFLRKTYTDENIITSLIKNYWRKNNVKSKYRCKKSGIFD